MKDMMFGPGKRDQFLMTEIRRLPRRQTFSTRRINAAKPGRVRLAQATTAITGGYQFRFYLLGGNVAGYRIYRSLTNNANIADAVDYVQQPPSFIRQTAFTWQETTSDTPFYWVASVSPVGKESDRVAMLGTAAPTPPPEAPPPGDPGEGGGGGVSGGEEGPFPL